MSGAVKHMQRSHKTYGKNVDFKAFERKAQAKKVRKENKSLFDSLKQFVHRTTNK